MRVILTSLLCLSLLGSCTSNTDPSTVGYWIDRLDDKAQRREALKQLGKLGDPVAVPDVIEWLEQEGDWQPDAAYTLGQLGDKQAVPKLLAAIDYQVGSGRDRASRNKNRININAVRALAMLGAKENADRVIKLLGAGEATVREAAIQSLGRLGNAEGTKPLIKVVLNDRQPFLRKTAIKALGDLGDPKAVPTLIKMLFIEVPGISFYNEARFALIQIGKPAAPELIKTLERKNRQVEGITLGGGANIGEGAIEAKAASVLGYLGAKQAEGQMINALNKLYARFKKRASAPVYASVPGAIIELCYALGNLGTPAAAKALAPLAGAEWEVDSGPIRLAAGEALTQIGDRSAVTAMLKAAKTGDVPGRRAALAAAGRLGDASNLAAFKALAKVGGKGVPVKVMAKVVKQEAVRLEAAKECKTDLACWTDRLDDTNPKVRDKAAWELGWLGKKEAMPALLKAAEDSNAIVRMAAVLSLGRIGDVDKDKLQHIYDTWAKKLDYQGVNQELLRLIARLSSNN
ncbi:MAG: HEAT repeat domain-containing protein [Myxococcota bacterium]